MFLLRSLYTQNSPSKRGVGPRDCGKEKESNSRRRGTDEGRPPIPTPAVKLVVLEWSHPFLTLLLNTYGTHNHTGMFLCTKYVV